MRLLPDWNGNVLCLTDTSMKAHQGQRPWDLQMQSCPMSSGWKTWCHAQRSPHFFTCFRLEMQTNTTFWGDERMGDEGCLSASSLLLRWVSIFTTALRCLAESMTTNEQKIELPLKSTVWRSLPTSCYFPPPACISTSVSSPLPGPIAEGGVGLCMESTICRERRCLPQPGKTGSSWSSKSFL